MENNLSASGMVTSREPEPQHCASQLMLGIGLMGIRVTVSYEVSLPLADLSYPVMGYERDS